jgi:NADPH:quinone reductase-like Zn-dependent oxidoreductase
MKAIVYTKYGPPEVLRIEEISKPIPKDNEVLIRVRATEVTKADCEMRSFNFQVKWFSLPLRLILGIFNPRKNILGGYFTGEVEEVGKSVKRFKVGDSLFGSTRLRLGAYGEYLTLPEDYTLIPMPSNLSFAEAAAVPLGGLNALHFMRKANITVGEKVLINGAGGSRRDLKYGCRNFLCKMY